MKHKMWQFMRSKDVTIKELDEYFQVVGRRENGGQGMCGACGSPRNIKTVASEPWTTMQYCWECDAITVYFPPDLMSGCENVTPSVVYKEKE